MKALGLSLTAVAVLAVAGTTDAGAGPPFPFNLTGTWEGKVTCKGLSLGEKAKTVSEGLVKISQSGTELALEFDPDGNLEPSLDFAGFTAPESGNPDKGQLVATYCGTSPFINSSGQDHIVHAKGVIKPTDANPYNATLKMTSIVGAYPNVAVCKWKFTRTDITDPSAPGCPPPI
jgi:hypothetical protein